MSLPLVTAPEIFRKTVRYCSKRAVISLLKNRRISGLTFLPVKSNMVCLMLVNAFAGIYFLISRYQFFQDIF